MAEQNELTIEMEPVRGGREFGVTQPEPRQVIDAELVESTNQFLQRAADRADDDRREELAERQLVREQSAVAGGWIPGVATDAQRENLRADHARRQEWNGLIVGGSVAAGLKERFADVLNAGGEVQFQSLRDDPRYHDLILNKDGFGERTDPLYDFRWPLTDEGALQRWPVAAMAAGTGHFAPSICVPEDHRLVEKPAVLGTPKPPSQLSKDELVKEARVTRALLEDIGGSLQSAELLAKVDSTDVAAARLELRDKMKPLALRENALRDEYLGRLRAESLTVSPTWLEQEAGGIRAAERGGVASEDIPLAEAYYNGRREAFNSARTDFLANNPERANEVPAAIEIQEIRVPQRVLEAEPEGRSMEIAI
jgi:hypothetical protein